MQKLHIAAPTALLFIFAGNATNISGPLALPGGTTRGAPTQASAVGATLLVAITAKK